MLAWSFGVLVYYLFEVNAIGTGHDYYLFPFYPLLFILVAYGVVNILNLKNRFVRYLTLLASGKKIPI